MTHDPELLEALSNLGEVEAEIARLQSEREALRARLSEIVAIRHNSKVVLPGYGTIQIRAPGVARVWDGRALEELVTSLRETGHGETADEIERCRKASERPGGLSISREKPKS